MKRGSYICILVVCCLFSHAIQAQYELAWLRSYGRSGDDGGKSVVADPNGGMWMIGYTQELGNLKANWWIIKVNDEGRNLWERIYGGKKWDEARAAVATADGGLAVVGTTESMGKGKSDVWLMKLNANGELEWEELYGGKSWDEAFSLKEAKDGGFFIAGSYAPKRKEDDLWVIRTDSRGQMIWEVKEGGNAWEGAHNILELPNGQVFIVGHAASNGLGKDDGWLLCLSAKGEVLWNKHYGGGQRDALHSLLLKNDSSVLMAGFTKSLGNGQADLWLLEIDLEGNVRWEKTIGGGAFEKARSIIRTADGNYMLAGYTHSKGLGNGDMWVVKLSPEGEFLWERTFGGEGYDKGFHLTSMDNGDVVVIGNIDLNGQQNILAVRLKAGTEPTPK